MSVVQDNKDLLEDLRVQTELEYLSDIKLTKNRPKAAKAIMNMETDHYTLKQWEEALSYILERSVKVDSEGDILRHIENMI